jgi:hypothetical protein
MVYAGGEAGPYAAAALAYVEVGWRPIPVEGKAHPPRGYTGWNGAEASVPDVHSWLDGGEAQWNLALRLPAGIVGIDVDAHDHKLGLQTFMAAQAALGMLPPTWTSTSRGPDQPSRIHLFRADPEVTFAGAEKRIREAFGSDVDVIHRSHRYALTYPSLHPAGPVYRWYEPSGAASLAIPKPEDLTELPAKWQQFLAAPVETTDTFTPVPAPKADRFAQPVPLGQRSNTARDYAWMLAHAGLEYEVARLAAWGWWQLYVQQAPGDEMPFTEVETALRNAYQKVATQPVEQPVDDRADIEREKYLQRVRRAAKRELDAEEEEKAARLPVSALTLAEDLAKPEEEITFTIEKLLTKGGNALLAAKYKSGKTTLGGNLLRSIADGLPFLGQFQVRALTGRVAYWNYEVGEAQFLRWLRDMTIENPERVSTLHLRGFRVPLITKPGADWLVQWLAEREVEFLIVDPFARAYTGAGDENSNREVGAWLDALDVVKARAGVTDLVLMHHFGRGDEERARGASRLDDWPDVRWLLVADEEGNRYFSAHGRDVEVPEFRLDMDMDLRRLTAGKGNRQTNRLSAEVLSYLADHPGATAKVIQAEIPGRNGDIGKAVAQLVEEGLIRVQTGQHNSKMHFLSVGPMSASPLPPASPTFPGAPDPRPPSPSFRRGDGEAREIHNNPQTRDPEHVLLERVRSGEGCELCGAKATAFFEPWFKLRCTEHNPIKDRP